jgi:hypothetical protein
VRTSHSTASRMMRSSRPSRSRVVTKRPSAACASCVRAAAMASAVWSSFVPSAYMASACSAVPRPCSSPVRASLAWRRRLSPDRRTVPMSALSESGSPATSMPCATPPASRARMASSSRARWASTAPRSMRAVSSWMRWLSQRRLPVTLTWAETPCNCARVVSTASQLAAPVAARMANTRKNFLPSVGRSSRHSQTRPAPVPRSSEQSCR